MNYAPLEELKTLRLVLRKLRMADLEDYYLRLGSHRDVTRYMLWQPHTSVEESRASIQKVLTRYQESGCYCWAIARKDDDSLIGRIDLLRFAEEDSSCSFAYMLGKDFWNQGYGTEALRAVFAFATEKMEIKRIVADHMAPNTASGKVMEKAGMHYVRTLPGKYEKDGAKIDAVEYAIVI